LAVINRKIKEQLLTIKKNSITANEKTKDDNTNINKVLVVLYIKEISNDIKRVVGKGIDVRFAISKKLNSIIKKSKDRLDTRLNTDIVYKINCKDCVCQVYIGQTKRHLETYIKGHKNNIKFFRRLLGGH